MKTIKAKPISYDSTKNRNKKNIKYIIIHNTGNKGDTAINNANYYKNVNTRKAGAHFFIDQQGNVIKSIDLGRTAWSVGGSKYSDCAKTGGGKMYGIITNANSVSIELCDIVDKEPSDAMVKAICKTIKYIRKSCPNANTLYRHFDVNGKHCPVIYMNNDKWTTFVWKCVAVMCNM